MLARFKLLPAGGSPRSHSACCQRQKARARARGGGQSACAGALRVRRRVPPHTGGAHGTSTLPGEPWRRGGDVRFGDAAPPVRRAAPVPPSSCMLTDLFSGVRGPCDSTSFVPVVEHEKKEKSVFGQEIQSITTLILHASTRWAHGRGRDRHASCGPALARFSGGA